MVVADRLGRESTSIARPGQSKAEIDVFVVALELLIQKADTRDGLAAKKCRGPGGRCAIVVQFGEALGRSQVMPFQCAARHGIEIARRVYPVRRIGQ